MSSSQTNRMAGGVIITQFHPAPNDPIVAAGATIQQYQNKMIQKFSAGRPQVLGVRFHGQNRCGYTFILLKTDIQPRIK